MPAYRRRSTFARRRAPRRRTQWVDLDVNGSAAIGEFDNIDLLQTYRAMDGADTAGITILRTHARLWATGTVTPGDGVFWGFIVSDLQDLATGSPVGTGLNPLLNPYAPWALYQKYNAHPHYSFNGAIDQWEVDLRSKRRVPFGSTYMVSVGNQDAAEAFPFALHVRTLIALS